MIALFCYFISCIIHKTLNRKTIKIKKVHVPFKCIVMISINSIFEEVLFRGLLQNYIFQLSSNAVFSIFITVILFILYHFNKKRTFKYFLDILIFSVVISFLYQLYHNFIFVSLIHIFKNILVENYNRKNNMSPVIFKNLEF